MCMHQDYELHYEMHIPAEYLFIYLTGGQNRGRQVTEHSPGRAHHHRLLANKTFKHMADGKESQNGL